jgi:hypothetical protein
MKLTGLLLLPSGWIIVLAAVALLKPSVSQNVFVLAGVAVEILGMTLIVRAHLIPRGGRS